MYYCLYANNRVKKSYRLVVFSYANTKRIKVSIYRNAIEISVQLNKQYDFDGQNFMYRLMKDAIKRALFAYMLVYKKTLKIKTLTLIRSLDQYIIDKECDVTNLFKPYYSFDGRFRNMFNGNSVSDNMLQKVFTGNKNEYERKITPLYDFIISKTKDMETEKFIYLWMSYNSFYSHYFSAKSDREGMKMLIQQYGYGDYVMDKTHRERVLAEMKRLFYGINYPIIMGDILDDGKYNIKAKEFIEREYRGYHMSIYGFIISDFSYAIRCDLFHANSPLILFAYSGDSELTNLSIANVFIEDFLDRHILDLYE